MIEPKQARSTDYDAGMIQAATTKRDEVESCRFLANLKLSIGYPVSALKQASAICQQGSANAEEQKSAPLPYPISFDITPRRSGVRYRFNRSMQRFGKNVVSVFRSLVFSVGAHSIFGQWHSASLANRGTCQFPLGNTGVAVHLYFHLFRVAKGDGNRRNRLG